MPNQTTPVVFGNARFTVFSPGCIRLEYANQGRFTSDPSLLAGKKPARGIRADVRRRGKKLAIKTANFEVSYTDNGQNFSAENLKIVHRNRWNAREVWVPGKADRGNLGTVVRSLDVWKHLNGGPERFPVEGILSADGGHLLVDDARVYWNKRHQWPEVLSHDVWFDGTFFAYGPDYKSALRDFVRVFGPIPMVPRWVFGFWYSRWHAYSDREFVAMARRYRKAGIPIDVMVIDTDWRNANWGGYDWSPKFFPNPKRAMKKLRALDLRVTLNDHPGYDNYDALPPTDSHIPAIERELGPLPHQGQVACDWSNKKAVRVWRDKVLGPFFKQGMDFWWVDGWLKSPFKGVDSQFWANLHFYEVAREKTGKRGLILSRWGGIGSHRYPVQFSGDTTSDWATLRNQIQMTARGGNLGAAYWSHDIGGFFDGRVDEQLFARWIQFGSLSPVFRTHSCKGDREPWKYGKTVQRVFRKQTRMRYALAPYLYSLSREAHETGLPLVRPMYLEYPGETACVQGCAHQFLLGRDLLVAPAEWCSDAKTGAYRKKVFFPDDAWHALESGESIRGVDERVIDVPLDILPVYARGGAILPCQRVGDALGTRAPAEMQVDFYPAESASRFDLYEDDGESLDCERGRFTVTRLGGKRGGNGIRFTIAAPRGSYRGMPKSRAWMVRARLEPGERVVRAEIRTGTGPWKRIGAKNSNRTLAGEVRSGHTFSEVRVVSPNRAVEIRWILSE
jgi:hypothetical protein